MCDNLANLLQIKQLKCPRIQTLHSVLSTTVAEAPFSSLKSWIWGFSAILLCKAFQAQVKWGLSVDSHFQVSPDMFDWVQVKVLAGPL